MNDLIFEPKHKINFDRHVWEGWTVRCFILDLQPLFFRVIQNSNEFGGIAFENKSDLILWLTRNQPYYKKHIPEVYHYFSELLDRINNRNF